MKPIIIAFAASALMLVSSCSTPRDITYFQDANPGSVVDIQQRLDIRIKPEDKLSIMVNAQDPALSVLFNLVQNQNRIGLTSEKNDISTSANSDGRVSLYTVDAEGNINFPVLGKLHIAGMKRDELAAYICRKLQDENLVKDPIVTVEFSNMGLNILGEVASPGRYAFNKDRVNIIEALAMAGDVKPNGLRRNIKVMREVSPDRHEVYTLDLTDMSQMSASPAFYLQQNDVIYVEPNDKSKRETTPNGNTPYTPSFWISMASFAITITTLIMTLVR